MPRRLGETHFGIDRNFRRQPRKVAAPRGALRRDRPSGNHVRPIPHRAGNAPISIGLLGHREERRMDRRSARAARTRRQGRCVDALALGRHEAARSRRAGPCPQTSAHRARRTDGRRRRRTARGALELHRRPSCRGTHDHSHDPLPGGSAGSLRPRRHSRARPRRGA